MKVLPQRGLFKCTKSCGYYFLVVTALLSSEMTRTVANKSLFIHKGHWCFDPDNCCLWLYFAFIYSFISSNLLE